MDQSNVLIFVYGSLKRGLALHEHLNGCTFFGCSATKPNYRLFDCGDYPGMVPAATNGARILGEVYEVAVDCLANLDVVEAVDEGLFVRRNVELEDEFNRAVEAYFYCRPTGHLTELGNSWP